MTPGEGADNDGRNTRWDGHRRARRRELVQATILAINKHGTGISMDQIAEESKTSKSILYKYFGDKEGLQQAVGDYVIDEFDFTIKEALRENADLDTVLNILADLFLTLVDQYPHVYRFLKVERCTDDTVRAMMAEADSVMIDTWSRLFEGDTDVVDHPQFRGVMYMWFVGLSNLMRGIAESWMKARQGVSGPGAANVSALSESQAQFAGLDRDALQQLLVTSLAHAIEQVVTDVKENLGGNGGGNEN